MKKIVSTILVLALVLSCSVFAQGVLTDTVWKAAAFGQRSIVHFYEDTVRVENGNFNLNYTFDGSYLSITNSDSHFKSSAVVDKKVKKLTMSGLDICLRGHSLRFVGKLTMKRILPAIKKVAYKKVKLGTAETVVTITGNEATEACRVTLNGETIFQGSFENKVATFSYKFPAKSNKIVVEAYTCEKDRETPITSSIVTKKAVIKTK